MPWIYAIKMSEMYDYYGDEEEMKEKDKIRKDS